MYALFCAMFLALTVMQGIVLGQTLANHSDGAFILLGVFNLIFVLWRFFVCPKKFLTQE